MATTTLFQDLRTALVHALTNQATMTGKWHEAAPVDIVCTDDATFDNLSNLILMQHMFNFRLWHVEDIARRRDVEDSTIAQCKRSVDVLNQNRNDFMEKVDICLNSMLIPMLPSQHSERHNTESTGMIIDRLSILALKIFHMEEQVARIDVDDAHRNNCSSKLAVLQKQRSDLFASLLELLDDFLAGIKTPLVYYQFKMYNDPALNPEVYAGAKR